MEPTLSRPPFDESDLFGCIFCESANRLESASPAVPLLMTLKSKVSSVQSNHLMVNHIHKQERIPLNKAMLLTQQTNIEPQLFSSSRDDCQWEPNENAWKVSKKRKEPRIFILRVIQQIHDYALAHHKS